MFKSEPDMKIVVKILEIPLNKSWSHRTAYFWLVLWPHISTNIFGTKRPTHKRKTRSLPWV